MAVSILMVEDSPSNAALYGAYLSELGATIQLVDHGMDAIAAIERGTFQLMLLDLNLPDMDGIYVLRRAAALANRPATIVLTASGSVQRAVEAMREGAMDFLMKPCSAEKLRGAVRAALDRIKPSNEEGVTAEGTARRGPTGFLGDSPVMRAVFERIESAAQSSVSIFITGESGTGKELCARAIHESSPRSNSPFIALNCAAIPRELMESEVFGHKKGAFTGAYNDYGGAAAEAEGGTLFLDEICEMDLELQAKLLRFIQTGTYKRVGDTVERQSNIRFISATNRDPLHEVRAGRFRQDLYYRLHVVPIRMPPLRERGDDIILLAERFLRDLASIEGKHFDGFDAASIARMRRCPWPGNVRQLENTIRNIVVLHKGPLVSLDMLPGEMIDQSPLMEAAMLETSAIASPDLIPTAPNGAATTLTHEQESLLVRPLADLEMMAIEAALARFDGNVTKAARALDIAPSTIYRKQRVARQH